MLCILAQRLGRLQPERPPNRPDTRERTHCQHGDPIPEEQRSILHHRSHQSLVIVDRRERNQAYHQHATRSHPRRHVAKRPAQGVANDAGGLRAQR